MILEYDGERPADQCQIVRRVEMWYTTKDIGPLKDNRDLFLVVYLLSKIDLIDRDSCYNKKQFWAVLNVKYFIECKIDHVTIT